MDAFDLCWELESQKCFCSIHPCIHTPTQIYCSGFEIPLVRSSETSKNESRTSGIPVGLVRRTTVYFWFSHKLHWLYIFQTSEWYIRTSDFYNPLARWTSAFNFKFRSLRLSPNTLELSLSCTESSWSTYLFWRRLMKSAPIPAWKSWGSHHIWCYVRWSAHLPARLLQHLVLVPTIKVPVKSLWPCDAIWRHRSGSTLAQVMACCLTAPSHYLNQCWPLISEVLWCSPESNFTMSAQATILHNENYTFIISVTSPRGQWVNIMRPEQNGRHLADNISKYIYLE